MYIRFNELKSQAQNKPYKNNNNLLTFYVIE